MSTHKENSKGFESDYQKRNGWRWTIDNQADLKPAIGEVLADFQRHLQTLLLQCLGDLGLKAPKLLVWYQQIWFSQREYPGQFWKSSLVIANRKNLCPRSPHVHFLELKRRFPLFLGDPLDQELFNRLGISRPCMGNRLWHFWYAETARESKQPAAALLTAYLKYDRSH